VVETHISNDKVPVSSVDIVETFVRTCKLSPYSVKKLTPEIILKLNVRDQLS
jgi:hypothetical protein